MNRFPLLLAFLQSLLDSKFLGFISENLKNEIEQAITFIQSEGKMTIFRKLKKLKFLACVVVDAVEEFITRDFLKMGEVMIGNIKTKIWMSGDFQSKILNVAPQKSSYAGGSNDKLQLTADMWDSAITNELGNPSAYSISDFTGMIRCMITKQPKGENGDLLSNGYSNIFYVIAEDGRLLTVDVRWNSDDDEWNFSCYEFVGGDGRWYTGSCVWTPAIDA